MYTGGIDALGRPVIVVNTATALPPERSLDDVLGEMLPRLEPYLSQVRYGCAVQGCDTGVQYSVIQSAVVEIILQFCNAHPASHHIAI